MRFGPLAVLVFFGLVAAHFLTLTLDTPDATNFASFAIFFLLAAGIAVREGLRA